MKKLELLRRGKPVVSPFKQSLYPTCNLRPCQKNTEAISDSWPQYGRRKPRRRKPGDRLKLKSRRKKGVKMLELRQPVNGLKLKRREDRSQNARVKAAS